MTATMYRLDMLSADVEPPKGCVGSTGFYPSLDEAEDAKDRITAGSPDKFAEDGGPYRLVIKAV